MLESYENVAESLYLLADWTGDELLQENLYVRDTCENGAHTIKELLHKLAAYEDAEEQGRLVVLDRETALAIAAGGRAIGTTKRFHGASYVYDPFGEDGGPYEIPYKKAEEILCNIWDKYPLDSEEAEAAMKGEKA